MATLSSSLPPSGSHEAKYVRRIAVASLGENIWRFSLPPAKKTKIRKKNSGFLGLINIVRCKVYYSIKFINRSIMLLEIFGRSPNIRTVFDPPIRLRGKYELALIGFNTFYSVPNVNYSNCNLHYYDGSEINLDPANADSGIQVLKIPYGHYEAEEIADYIHANLKGVVITIDKNIGRAKLEVTGVGLILDFNQPNSIGKILGFTEFAHYKETLTGQNLINITSLASIQIHCDIVSQGYVNGKETNLLWSFMPSIPPHYILVKEMANPIY